jgi:hypothetical protein
MKTDTYTQCELVKEGIDSVAWIPTKFAVVGKILRIKENGVWTDGWYVSKIFNHRYFKEVEERERDYKKFDYTK